MATTRSDDLKSSASNSESTDIYKILAREELDIATRYKFLKKFTRTTEGMQMLAGALDIAQQAKATHDSIVDLEKYTARTAIPNRVIADLEDNIRMGKIAIAHPRLFSKVYSTQHVAIDNLPTVYTRKY